MVTTEGLACTCVIYMCRVARGASAPRPCRGRGATRPRAAGAGVCALRGRAQVATTPQRHPTGRSRGCTPPPLSSLIPIRHFCKKPTVVAAPLPFFEGCKRTADPSERSQTMSTRRWVWSRCACIRFFLWESFDKASPAFGSFSAEGWGEMATGLDRAW